MTEPTEAAKQKACELANDEIAKGYEGLERVRENGFWTIQDLCAGCEPNEVMALARVLQEHSDVAKGALARLDRFDAAARGIQSLILPDEPDPLAVALAGRGLSPLEAEREADRVRADLKRMGKAIKIVEAEQ